MIQRQLTLYRLHFIDRKSGTIERTFEFHAEDDGAAVEFATVWTELAPMELRNGRGRVMFWPVPGDAL